MAVQQGCIYLLDISVSSKDLNVPLVEAIDSVINDNKRVKLLLAVKVVAEARFLFVIRAKSTSDPDALAHRLSHNITVDYNISCTALRPYESFAKNLLGVDDALCGQAPYKLSPGGHLYMLNFEVEYKGMSQDILMRNWKEEAQFALTTRQQGTELELFKAMGERKIVAFINVNTPEQLDDIAWNLPIMKSIGDQVHILCKSVRLYSDYLQDLQSNFAE
ncbi:uncharacterized protein LOC106154566 [Lingula anatina]|uniref:Uncharacterized protein LOC106154566 n=2 Tax=Lingula anatina TaxID=7574 RepID=A0A1S3HEB3_LINAN|nr:uncharacterized protein LOC106154566 [Lingula anatina]|eukprot:XP_013384412.1 uncharacterized protein LOC106154566 [Lingula anatina]